MHHRQLSEQDFRAAVQPHLRKLYRVALRLVATPAAAEDLVQELLVRLWERPGRLMQATSAEAWLVRALCHLHIDMVRRDRRRPEGTAVTLDEAMLAGAARAEPGAEQAWRVQQVLRLLRQLPVTQRLVVVLHDIEGYSLKESARILGVRIGTAKSRLGRAHKTLRAALAGNAFADSDVLGDEVQSDAMSTV